VAPDTPRVPLVTTLLETSREKPAGVVKGPVTLVVLRVVAPETPKVPLVTTLLETSREKPAGVLKGPVTLVAARVDRPDTLKVPPSTMLVNPKLVAFIFTVFKVVAFTVVALRLAESPLAVRF